MFKRSPILFWIGLIALGSTLAIAPQVSAKTPVEVGDIAKTITVSILIDGQKFV